jgi:hypothetical protein
MLRHGIPRWKPSGSGRPTRLGPGIHLTPFGKRTIMNTLLAPQRLSGIPDTQRLASRTPHTSPLDRVALHIGVRLLIWGSRAPRLTEDREAHSRLHSVEAARASREHGYQRESLLAPRV